MSDEKKFPDGLIVKEGNVDFCKAKLSIKADEFIKYLHDNSNNGWVNIDILLSKNGKLYASLNNFKPDTSKKTEVKQDEGADLPF